jgi:uncharacterized phage protein (TIGR02218 family)
MSSKDDLIETLKTGAATTCHAWLIVRKDGRTFGFTDHDNDLEFEGAIFKANSGLIAGALQLSSGMSVDNTEVSGALTDDGLTELDLSAGRFDGAMVTTWLVNWANVAQRVIRFRGSFGEIQRSDEAFKVELRSLSEALNQQKGRVYQPNCAAVLGDHECRFDLRQPGFSLEAQILSIGDGAEYRLDAQPDYPQQWFERGRITVLNGRAEGLLGVVKFDREVDGGRQITLWVNFDLAPQAGDIIKLEAGCDKLASTCRSKFDNFLNFRGFPHIPGTDWVASYPVANQRNDGGSRQK